MSSTASQPKDYTAARQLVGAIYAQVDDSRIDQAVRTAVRLARKVSDTYNSILFARELGPDGNFLDDLTAELTVSLREESREALKRSVFERWLSERTYGYLGKAAGDEPAVLTWGIGELLEGVETIKATLAELESAEKTYPHNEAERIAITEAKIKIRTTSRMYRAIIERIGARCLHYAARVESQLDAAERADSFMTRVQNDVHNYYAERCEPVYVKLQKAVRLIDSDDPEDHALLLTSIRRAVKAVADYHYPPREGLVTCRDGEERSLTDDRYLNRLREFFCWGVSRKQFGRDVRSRTKLSLGLRS